MKETTRQRPSREQNRKESVHHNNQHFLPHVPSPAQERNEKKEKGCKAGQTSIDTHPAQAPEGKTSGKPGYRSSPLSIQTAARKPAACHLCRQSESKKRISL
ncbi:hypothetical protein N657DRAFT_702006 [Parathielavia appendiculata]|uniref:Uncharacterized protein n=1 Tax=Parathielavia appendiculata TaxID=2587402 RepID=A0AAN6TTD0_9PEZI|nr:hypothetical protein N657DRAFT_702006 [Parathielavia appendiculata]